MKYTKENYNFIKAIFNDVIVDMNVGIEDEEGEQIIVEEIMRELQIDCIAYFGIKGYMNRLIADIRENRRK